GFWCLEEWVAPAVRSCLSILFLPAANLLLRRCLGVMFAVVVVVLLQFLVVVDGDDD
ncbi:hypothetical protein A2U01_0058430, partial [Trifolium medium]|nr:hypothetical protein [Trifolium medium]